MAQRQLPQAAEHLARSYAIFTQIGRLDGICMVGMVLGQILCAMGKKSEGLQILRRSRDGFLQLGQNALAQQAQKMIDPIERA
jgi:hypothetical protein